MQGKIIRLISNQYRVLLDDKRIVDCIAMGKIRLDKAPIAGDLVDVETYDDKYGIEKIYPRRNQLIRPPIANVDQAIIVMSAVEPDFSMTLVDQLIFLITCANIKPIIMISKMDLVKDMRVILSIIEDYQMGGYQVITTGKDENDQQVIAEVLKDKITVLAGQSGVGKSSFLNRINPEFMLVTQKISQALGRGKHTTRHVELHQVMDGWVADTPGFSKLDFSNLTKDELANAVIDFAPYRGQCRFRDCLHDKEPGCAIKEAVEKGKVSKIRYLHYQQCLGFIEEKRKDIYD
ncbi:MAG: ribosome small subunit-dependent GTPase A [Erysipelotrichaceae bacterium]|nr:ribosome small subunit-dependent GTPase A [Erysipelotrichaceae bacterium]MDD3923971.1 ribosome small subunit-dependent GTPase A [Erysipelotrichaceae bacterium]MDD4642812.1 ribosome small subunit-dependent GTPase A [Erysipelotrichaceae bacterium]